MTPHTIKSCGVRLTVLNKSQQFTEIAWDSFQEFHEFPFMSFLSWVAWVSFLSNISAKGKNLKLLLPVYQENRYTVGIVDFIFKRVTDLVTLSQWTAWKNGCPGQELLIQQTLIWTRIGFRSDYFTLARIRVRLFSFWIRIRKWCGSNRMVVTNHTSTTYLKYFIFIKC